jgi:exonuclease III
LAGDFNVVPTDFDIYNPRSWRKNALLRPESRACWERLLAQGWVDAIRVLHPDEPIFTFWDYFRQHWERNAGLRIDHLFSTSRWPKGSGRRVSILGSAASRMRAITRPRGLSWICSIARCVWA